MTGWGTQPLNHSTTQPNGHNQSLQNGITERTMFNLEWPLDKPPTTFKFYLIGKSGNELIPSPTTSPVSVDLLSFPLGWGKNTQGG